MTALIIDEHAAPDRAEISAIDEPAKSPRSARLDEDPTEPPDPLQPTPDPPDPMQPDPARPDPIWPDPIPPQPPRPDPLPPHPGPPPLPEPDPVPRPPGPDPEPPLPDAAPWSDGLEHP
jgi:zinc transporter 1/2/3